MLLISFNLVCYLPILDFLDIFDTLKTLIWFWDYHISLGLMCCVNSSFVQNESLLKKVRRTIVLLVWLFPLQCLLLSVLCQCVEDIGKGIWLAKE
jgi:hypothetical protein